MAAADGARRWRAVVRVATTHTVIVRAASAAEARRKARADDVVDDWLDHSRAGRIVVVSVVPDE